MISHYLGLQHVRDGSFIAISSFAGIGMDGGRSGSGIRPSGIEVAWLQWLKKLFQCLPVFQRSVQCGMLI